MNIHRKHFTFTTYTFAGLKTGRQGRKLAPPTLSHNNTVPL